MLALTLVQPWAFAIMHLGKDVENRSWSPPVNLIGQRFALHAGQKRSKADVLALRELGFDVPDRPIQGAIVATVRLDGWVFTETGREVEYSAPLSKRDAFKAVDSAWYEIGHVGWVLSEVRLIEEPIACKGALGMWRVPSEFVIAA